jgi:hypothetical protein
LTTVMCDVLRIMLELEPGAEPVRGTVCAEGADARRFDGYVQLIGLLEELQPRAATGHEREIDRCK